MYMATTSVHSTKKMLLCFTIYADVVIEFTEKRVPINVIEMTSNKNQLPFIMKLINIVLKPMKSIIDHMQTSTFNISIDAKDN